MELIPFNLNHYVKVKLTEKGREIHKAEFDECFGINNHMFPYNKPYEDHEGYSRWQLWNLMQTFGKYCYNGCEIPFETKVIFEHENN